MNNYVRGSTEYIKPYSFLLVDYFILHPQKMCQIITAKLPLPHTLIYKPTRKLK